MLRMTVFIVLFLFFAQPLVGLAHSYVQTSSPEDGEVVNEPVQRIELFFDGGIESLSTAEVNDQSGQPYLVDELESTTDQLTIYMEEPLYEGVYTVLWTALGDDTHVTEGEFTFQVAEGVVPESEPVDEQVEEEQVEEVVPSTVDETVEPVELVAEEEIPSSPGRFIFPIVGTIIIVSTIYLYQQWRRRR